MLGRVQGMTNYLQAEARPAASEGSDPVEPEPDLTVVVESAARQSRDEEFTEFVRTAGADLARTAWFLCGDAYQAEELTQQALVRTYVKWHRARAGDPLVYARRVLANQRIDSWRKRRREVLAAEPPERVGEDETGMLAERDRLVRALLALPPRRRKIVVLRHLVGLRESEVADDLGISVGTVKSTVSRSLAQLRATLGEHDHLDEGTIR